MRSLSQVAAQTIPDPEKAKNGDSYAHADIAEGLATVVMVADGVGSKPCDWLASKTACDRLTELAKEAETLLQNPAQWLRQALISIDQEIAATTGRSHGMMCVAAAAIVMEGSTTAWFTNVGDTRVYKYEDPNLKQISIDDSRVVVRRKPDGRPMVAEGSVVTQRGVTNALGSGEANVTVNEVNLPPGAGLVLCSDGLYSCSRDLTGDVVNTLSQPDLEGALARMCRSYSGKNRDDATVLAIRRPYPALDDKQLAQAFFYEMTIPRHAVAAAIGSRLEQAVAQLDEGMVRGFISYLKHHSVLLDRTCCDTAIRKMAEVGWKDRKSFEALLAMIRSQA